ncbi:SLATT domain-containing protein [Myroides odoratimimus]|uniref:SLATT domain-containing protein n=1 Tax=Myroides odoratimimus TaxID=76832 RepID=UPI0038D3983F
MKEELERWYKKLWETKGSRFISAKRYDRIDRYSSLTINIITAYILCINLLVLLPSRPEILSNDNLSYFSICASIILLVISLIVSSRKYGEISHKFHSCAREITIIYDEICIMRSDLNNTTFEDLKVIMEKYNHLLIKYDINHSSLDYDIFKCLNHKEYKIPQAFLFIGWTYFKNFIYYYLIFFISIILPIVSLGYILK